MMKKEKSEYKILINTAVRDKKEVKLMEGEREVGKKFGDIDTVSSIRELLNKNNLKPSDISEYVPNLGPGSFTGLKVGVTISNVLNWMFGKKKLNELDVPEYGSEPNIQK
ncbi:MAG: hypothetical protein ABIA11_02325 [Patescibacteria group bacterium]